MKYLLPVLFCLACAILMFSQPRLNRVADSGPPSPALLDAMSSHGIEVGTAADAAADAPTPTEVAVDAGVPQMQPATFSDQAPVMLQPAVYHRNGR